MRAASGWQSREDYTRFLTLQFAARAPVEDWLAEHAPDDLRPPAQCALIAEDLTALGSPTPAPMQDFSLAEESEDESGALGVAWVLAGSSLGNRSILKEVERVGAASPDGDGEWPHSFLADDDMLAFWKALRGRIERPANIAEVEAASMAATAVFDHFLRAAGGSDEHSA